MSSERSMLRGALIPTLIVGIFSIIISTVVKGSAGLVGSLLAQGIVLIFFATHLAVARLTRDADPMTTMALAMASYFVKLFIFGGFLLLVTKLIPETHCNKLAFGLSSIIATFTWLGGEIAAYFRLKTHLQLPPK
jgi:ATP synthase protein I